MVGAPQNVLAAYVVRILRGLDMCGDFRCRKNYVIWQLIVFESARNLRGITQACALFLLGLVATLLAYEGDRVQTCTYKRALFIAILRTMCMS